MTGQRIIASTLAMLAWLSCVLNAVGNFSTAGETQAESSTSPFAVDDGLTVPAGSWPWWRGPLRTGVVTADSRFPMQWSDDSHVAWKVPVPGRGHSSAIIWKQHLFLTTADEKSGDQFVIALDAVTGKTKWNTRVHAGGGMFKNSKASAASSSVATDGERVYVNFPNRKAVYTTALDFNGKQIWQQKICDYAVHQGYGSSPALYQNLVIVTADNKAGGVVAALDRATGKKIWEKQRPKTPNYPSPILLKINGRDQVLLTGCNLVSSYAPLTGELLWETEGATTECVTSTVTDGTHIYSSGGYPKNHIAAIKADGSGKIAWESKDRVYVPSLLCKDGTLYGVLDAGVAMCWDSATGKQHWKARLGGNFTSSPVLVGDRIYVTNEKGTTFIYRASPAGYEKLAENVLKGNVYSTPTFADGRIYYRLARQEQGKHKEYLYCLSESAE